MFKQNLKIKSPIVNINYCLNQTLPIFDNLNRKLSFGFCLVNTFFDCFLFNIVKCKDAKNKSCPPQQAWEHLYSDLAWTTQSPSNVREPLRGDYP